jgi:hypothetical protein
MYYFKLYDDLRLNNLKHSKKINIVNSAVKLYRKDHPLNLTKRLIPLTIFCLVPALVLLYLFGIGLTVGWFALSTMFFNINTASNESSNIEPYLDQVLSGNK